MTNRIVQGISWTTVSSVVRNLVHVLQLVILTRILEKTDFGIVALAHLFISFTALFLDMGISVGIIHRQSITNKEYSSLFWLNVFLGTLLTGGLFCLAPYITAKYHSQDLTNVVRLICFSIFLSALGTQQRTYCQKKTFFARLAIIEILGSFITMAVAVFTAMNGFGVYSLAYSTLAGSFFINITHLIVGLIKDSRLSFHFSIIEVLPFLRIGVYQVGASILDFLTRELDILIISSTLGLEFLGVYNIAKRIPAAIYSFIQPIVTRVFAPLLAEKQADSLILKENYIRLSKSLSWVSFPIFLFLASIDPTVISIVFGATYLEGVPIMMVFCFQYAFNGVNGVCGALQTATGRTDIGLVWTVYLIASTAIVYYVTSLFGINVFLFGIVGITIVNVFMVWLIQFRVLVNIKFVEYLSVFIRSFLICIVLSAIVYLVYSKVSLLYSVCAGVIYVLVYLLAIFRSSDGRTIVHVLNSLGVPNKILLTIQKVTNNQSYGQ